MEMLKNNLQQAKPEIHGVINREDAWQMWRPYGERIELDGSIDPSNITPADAYSILWGAERKDMYSLWKYWYDPNSTSYWLDGIRGAVADNPDPRLIEELVVMHAKQQTYAETQRARALEQGPKLIKLLSGSINELGKDGTFTRSEVEQIQSRLVGPDGLPYMQYSPVSQLECTRNALKYDKEEPSYGTSAITDFSFGILRSALSMRRETFRRRLHNKIHESVHGFSGVEIYDITRVDGWRHPNPSIVGVFMGQPSVEIAASDNYSELKNSEINEGWTEYISRRLMHIEPGLGAPNKGASSYCDWAATVARIHKNDRGLFRVITQAVLIDATTENPQQKQDAIADMHIYADKILGESDALNTLFQNSGGKLTDIHIKGKE